MPAGAGRGRLVLLAVTLLALVAAVTVLGVLAARQSDTLRSLQRSLTTADNRLSALGATQHQLLSQLGAQRSTLSGVQNRLQATQTQLSRDEQKLKLTRAQLPPDVTKLAAQVAPSVVIVNCGGGFGTGFAFASPPPTGYGTVVVTAAHVVAACVGHPGRLSVTQNGTALTSRLSGVDRADDVALLDLVPRLPALQAASTIAAGQFVMSIGTPQSTDLEGSVTTGVVSKVYPNVFVDDAPISNGNSGGPLVDRNGDVLGFTDAASIGTSANPVAENVNFAYRMNVLCLQLLPAAGCPG